jgi:glutamate--cysteine ligase
MSQYVPEAGAAVQIERRDQLVEYFTSAAKPPADWRIGTEYEKVAVRPDDGRAVPFGGPDGIEALLRGLAERYGWEPIEEEGHTIALTGRKAAITLEPGGQLELSGEVCDSIHCARAEFSRHIDEIVSVGSELGIVFLGLGMQPVSRVEEIELVPKRRYGIMGPYMRKVGTLGLRMMTQTATVQVNMDFADESDAMMKMRAGMGLAPLINAMFANSPLSDGDLNRYLSFRGHIWTDTDRARCGLLPFVFRSSAGFEDYVDYALGVPMYFIVRDGEWIDMTSHTFAEFLADGHGPQHATMDDWNSHLTTLFPEVRLKKYIELRSADSQSPELMLAVPALAKGVFYEPDCLLAAWDLVKRWSWEERLQVYHDAHRMALRARVRGITLAELARELLQIAIAGLERQRVLDPQGEDESIYLERIEHLVKRGSCPADIIIDKWIGEWGRDIRRLIEGSSYRIAA